MDFTVDNGLVSFVDDDGASKAYCWSNGRLDLITSYCGKHVFDLTNSYPHTINGGDDLNSFHEFLEAWAEAGGLVPNPEQLIQWLGDSYVAPNGKTYLEDKSVEGGDVTTTKSVSVGDGVGVSIDSGIQGSSNLRLEFSAKTSNRVAGRKFFGTRNMTAGPYIFLGIDSSDVNGYYAISDTSLGGITRFGTIDDEEHDYIFDASNGEVYVDNVKVVDLPVATFVNDTNIHIMSETVNGAPFGFIEASYKYFRIYENGVLVLNLDFTTSNGGYVINTVTEEVLPIQNYTPAFWGTTTLPTPKLKYDASVWTDGSNEYFYPYNYYTHLPIFPQGSTPPTAGLTWVREEVNSVTKGYNLIDGTLTKSVGVFDGVGTYIPLLLSALSGACTIRIELEAPPTGSLNVLYSKGASGYRAYLNESNKLLVLADGNTGVVLTAGEKYCIDIVFNNSGSVFDVVVNGISIGYSTVQTTVDTGDLIIGARDSGSVGLFLNANVLTFNVSDNANIDFTTSNGSNIINTVDGSVLPIQNYTSAFWGTTDLDKPEIKKSASVWTDGSNEYRYPYYYETNTPIFPQGSTPPTSGLTWVREEVYDLDGVEFYNDRYDAQLSGSNVGYFNGSDNYVTGTDDRMLSDEFYIKMVGHFSSSSNAYASIFCNSTSSSVDGSISFERNQSNAYLDLILHTNGVREKFKTLSLPDVFDDSYHTLIATIKDGYLTFSIDGEDQIFSTIFGESLFNRFYFGGRGSVYNMLGKLSYAEVNGIKIPFSNGAGNKVYNTVDGTPYTINGDTTNFWQTSEYAFDRNRQLGFSKYDFPNIAVNGDFEDGDNGWELPAAWSISGGVAFTTTAFTDIKQNGIFTVGKTYKIEFDCYSETDSQFFVATYNTTKVGNGLLSIIHTATEENLRIRCNGSASVNNYIDNVVVKEYLADEDALIPSSTTTPTQDIFGNPLTNPGTKEGLNGSENGIIQHPDLVSYGNTFAVNPWNDTVWYDDIVFDYESAKLWFNSIDVVKDNWLVYSAAQEGVNYNKVVEFEDMKDYARKDADGTYRLDSDGEYIIDRID